ncbi:Unknown protein, partial [Striga hermonthica]
LAHKILRQGYYWPTLKKDTFNLVRRCVKCQTFAPNLKQPAHPLTSVFSPWPFAKWGIDLIEPLPTGKGGVKYAVVAVDYFIKWAEAEPLATITEQKMVDFLWKSIICRFGIPHSVVTDNRRQFEGKRFGTFCEELGIRHHFSTPYHPQSNGQAEAINKIIKQGLKVRLESSKGAWPEELPNILWSYRTTTRSATGETPFSLAYGAEAMVPVEIGSETYRVKNFEEEANSEGLRTGLDLIEEARTQAELKNVVYKRATERHFNARVNSHGVHQATVIGFLIVIRDHGRNLYLLGQSQPLEFDITNSLEVHQSLPSILHRMDYPVQFERRVQVHVGQEFVRLVILLQPNRTALLEAVFIRAAGLSRSLQLGPESLLFGQR